MRLTVAGLVTLTLLFPIGATRADGPEAAWPRRVLLTNDDGIQERRLHALARAFAEVAETWVVASFEDRSGSSNYTSFGKYQRTLLARREHVEEGLALYGVAGYPADAVLLGVKGILGDEPPDLVVSGVNGGNNLGTDGWWASGTIGAARAAAFLGIPAIAASGLDDDDPEMVARVTDWIVRFAQSPIVRDLEPGQYLTVAFPEVPAAEIEGVRFAPRMPSILRLSLDRVHFAEDDGGETEEIWLAELAADPSGVSAESDGALLRQGYVVVTPMRLGEVDAAALADLAGNADRLPGWPVASPAPPPRPR